VREIEMCRLHTRIAVSRVNTGDGTWTDTKKVNIVHKLNDIIPSPVEEEDCLHDLQGCRLFLGDLGTIGITSAAAQIGDVMCFLFTVMHMCVIRLQTCGRWILIRGTCYSTLMPRAERMSNETYVQEFFEDIGMQLGLVEKFMLT
jgi:hypothetical protein